jgi:hypothetical protein
VIAALSLNAVRIVAARRSGLGTSVTSFVSSYLSNDYLTSGSYFGRLAMNLSSTMRCALTNSGGSTPIHWAREMSA